MYGSPGLRYRSTSENCDYLMKHSSERKCTFMRQNNLLIWNGQFGPVYDSEGPEKDTISGEIYQMLQDQLSLCKAKNIVGWSICTYKDIGFQGSSPSSTRLKKFFRDNIPEEDRKRSLGPMGKFKQFNIQRVDELDTRE
jgi:hypothetical protein